MSGASGYASGGGGGASTLVYHGAVVTINDVPSNLTIQRIEEFFQGPQDEEKNAETYEKVVGVVGEFLADKLKEKGLLRTHKKGSARKTDRWVVTATVPSLFKKPAPKVDYMVNAPFHALLWPHYYHTKNTTTVKKEFKSKRAARNQADLLKGYGLDVTISEYAMVQLMEMKL